MRAAGVFPARVQIALRARLFGHSLCPAPRQHQRQQQHAPPPSGRLSRATLRPGGVRARARRAVFASRDDLAALVSEFSYGKLSELAAAARALARYVDDLETELEAADDAVPP